VIEKLSKFGLFLVIGILSLNSFGQDKCDLRISVYEFKEDGSSEQFPVKDAKITLVNRKTKKSLKISKAPDISTFTEVEEGEYELSVKKAGFKQTLSIFRNDCNFVDAQNIETNIVFLWKGSAKETVRIGGSGTYGATGSATTQERLTAYEIADGKPANSLAVSLVKPEYPKAARAVNATGTVNVQVTINELGYVISAQAMSGHPLLRAAAVKAAKASKFRTTLLEGFPVKVTGIIVYNFVP
jgi:TonB family protein